MKILNLMLVLFLLTQNSFAGPSATTQSQGNSYSQSTPSVFMNSPASNVKTQVMLDFIGATKGYTNLNIDFRLDDKTSTLVLFADQIKEERKNAYSTFSAKGFAISKYLIGDFGQKALIIGLGPLSTMYFSDKGELSTNLSVAAHLSGQLVLKNDIFIRLYGLASSLEPLSRLGVQVGLGF